MADTKADVATEVDILPGTEMLADVKYEIVTYEEADATERTRIDKLMEDIDLSDSNSVIFFW